MWSGIDLETMKPPESPSSPVSSRIPAKLQKLKPQPNRAIYTSIESWDDVHHPCTIHFHSRSLGFEKSEVEKSGVHHELNELQKLKA